MRTRRYFLAGVGVLFSGCLHGGTDDGSQGDGEMNDEDDQDGGETDGQQATDGEDSGGGDERETETNGEAEETGDDGESGEGETGTDERDGSGDGELDLREANVMGVSVEGSDGRYRFDVTLYHDDEGEDGYANWWQVESLDGERLGRRELAHPHGTRRFTRSTTVETADETCVVVRGHDQTHGYGGRAVVVNVETGDTNVFTQGSEPSSFSEEDCP